VEESKKLKIDLRYLMTEPEYYDYCLKGCNKGKAKLFSLCSKDAGQDGVLFCLNPWKRMYLMQEDVMSSCNCLKPIGNHNKSKLMEIWNSKMAQTYRRNMINNNLSMCDYRCIVNPGNRADDRFSTDQVGL
jgi:MoaA/NifB/PqqE/SkfB family radical SAM enzyme